MSTHKPMVVAVDGPAGSGKSSICRESAAKLGWSYVNTGAIYRSLAVIADQLKISLDCEEALAELCEGFSRDLVWDSKNDRMQYCGDDISDLLNDAAVGVHASAVAKIPAVRERLLPVQRNMVLAAPEGALVDGRDIGTIVFPDAPLKIFMTASLEQRASRRLDQLSQRTNHNKELPALEDLKTEIARRDFQDQNRGLAPLVAAADAHIVDTTDRSFVACVDAVVTLIHEAQVRLRMS